MDTVNSKYLGLSDEQVTESRKTFGANTFKKSKGKDFILLLKEVITEPMFLLLLVACIIYFLVGQYTEGIIMLVAMVFVASISFFQERRSKKALATVKKMSQPKAKVMRNGRETEIYSEDLVIGDILMVEEGEQIPADAVILYSHDFSVDESILTGESFAIWKNASSEDNSIYRGSTVKTGSAVAKVKQIGLSTMIGKVGVSVEDIKATTSRFQNEIRNFIRIMAIAGVVAFIFVFLVNYINTGQMLISLLFALALAMSILPEEIPVAFSTFMALGSWRLLKEQVLAKDPQVVETLGSATVICIDKTGTITENKMFLAQVFSFADNAMCAIDECNIAAKRVLEYAMWSSEPSPFDPMEIAIHEAYAKVFTTDRRREFYMVHEYPLSGTPPAMTHIYENEKGERIIACKGGAEAVVQFCKLNSQEISYVLSKVKEMAVEGFRVLGVASATYLSDNFPDQQKDFPWIFEGLVALYDPPKGNIKEVLNKFYNAGIKVKIISGDYPETTKAIAKEIGFLGPNAIITGNEIQAIDDIQLRHVVNEKNIFARMFPEAKLRVVNALKKNEEIVAMTGDGVNDGPALKAANIGVSMGSKGTEIAKNASSIVLLDNDLSKMFYAIIMGRKIYSNLKKAIRYILSIHISIITTVLVPLLLAWDMVNIFSPIHIIFFELIMGPTCSIIYENEPPEEDIETSLPRHSAYGFLTWKELSVSITQGLIISVSVLSLYYLIMTLGYSKELVRTITFSTIVLANIFLTLENRSFKKSIIKTLNYKNPFIYFIVILTIVLLLVILYIPPVTDLFLLIPLTPQQFVVSLIIGFVSVMWLEMYKLLKNYYLGRA